MASSGLFCSTCGQMNDANAEFCSRCGAPQKPIRQTPVTAQQAAYSPQTGAPMPPAYQQTYAPFEFHGYGGFWIRVVAFIIDWIVVWIVTWPVRFFLFGLVGLRPHITFNNPAINPAVGFFAAAALIAAAFRLFIGWVYWAGMESSSYQATLGKMALGLKVTDLAGNRISFARATGRYFAKILSSMILLIGYIMVAFTERKQGLHDMLAGTVVLKKQ